MQPRPSPEEGFMDLRRKKIIISFVSAMLGSVLLGLMIYYMFSSMQPVEFNTLTSIQKYAAELPEFPTADDSDWENPQFVRFYETRLPNKFEKTLHFFGLGKRPPWSVHFLAQQLKAQIKVNHAKGLIDGKSSFIHIKAKAATKILVFGDIHGSFHSLLRDFVYLRDNGFVTEDLKLKNDQLFLIFNGDFINRSPYSVDALILLSLLMEKNPERVIYVGGKHERDGYWMDYSLKHELISRGRLFSKQAIPFKEQLLTFFASLPAAVYLSGSKDTKDVVRISFFGRNQLGFEEDLLNSSFLNQAEQVKVIQVGEQKSNDSRIDVRAAIESEEWKRSKRINNGIGLLDQNRGATTWGVLSSPTLVNRFYLNFNEDAFAALEINETVEEASISCIHHDIRKLENFIEDPPLNLISGRPADLKRLPANIKLGASMSLVRGIPTTGKQIKAGLSARINEYNRSSQTIERNIRLYIDNDDYEPEFARKNAQEHLDLGIRFFIMSLGTPTLFSYMDLLVEKKAVVFFPLSGSTALRSDKFPNLIHFRASYEDETRALIRAMYSEYGATKFAFFYQDDAFGKGPWNAAVEELKKLGIKDYLALPYSRGSSTFADQVTAIREFSPNALGFFSVATATKGFIRQMGVNDLLSMNMFALSSVGEVQFRRFIKHKGLTILFGSAVPNPFVGQRPISIAYREAMNKDNNILGVASFEAYIGASLFIHGLNQITSLSPTPMEVLKVIEGMRNVNFQGINLNFNPKTRSLAKEVFIETDDNSLWKEYAVD